jgi:SMI1 / KNR4 family (SUKH-1)
MMDDYRLSEFISTESRSSMDILQVVKSTYDKLSTISEITLEEIIIFPPVEMKELIEIEHSIGFTFPDNLRELYLYGSQSLSFNWTAAIETFGEECQMGGISILSPQMILNNYLEMIQMVEEAKLNSDELEENPGLKAMVNDWPNWIPVISFMNGDAFCINKKDNLSSVVFLEHDVMDGGPYIHGLEAASDIYDFLVRWSQIGFVDVYDWSKYIRNNRLDVGNSVFNRLREVLSKA